MFASRQKDQPSAAPWLTPLCPNVREKKMFPRAGKRAQSDYQHFIQMLWQHEMLPTGDGPNISHHLFTDFKKNTFISSRSIQSRSHNLLWKTLWRNGWCSHGRRSDGVTHPDGLPPKRTRAAAPRLLWAPCTNVLQVEQNQKLNRWKTIGPPPVRLRRRPRCRMSTVTAVTPRNRGELALSANPPN